MKRIELTQGKVALVDDADFESLIQHKWYARKMGNVYYAMRHGKRKLTLNQPTIFMHRVILGLQPGDKQQCDHRDGDGLNNQRANLRVCTNQQNGYSRKKYKVGTSKYKGVCWSLCAHKWQSQIQVKRTHIYLGYFNSERKAAQAYDVAAIKHHGDFALTNKMLGLLEKR